MIDDWLPFDLLAGHHTIKWTEELLELWAMADTVNFTSFFYYKQIRWPAGENLIIAQFCEQTEISTKSVSSELDEVSTG
jgi:hypothetical protein